MKIHCFKTISRITACFVILAFTTSLIISPQMANAQSVPSLPQPGAMLTPSHSFIPPYLIGITVNPENPFRFNFIVDTGNSNIEGEELRSESNKLIRYFLATMTIPEEDLWVNLSPYEKDRIIPDEFGKTEMGRDLLAQDYILKQFTASLMYPEDEIGNDFWDRVYKKANELYGTTEMPVNTFNKVWIVPDRAVVHEHNHSVMVVDTHLRVMLEEDYLATSKNLVNKEMGTDQLIKQDVAAPSNVYLSVIRDVLIPEIEKEVNEGEHFAPLRQIYHSMVLATWYKKKLRSSPLNAVYADQKKVAGVDVDDKEVNQKIYDQYIEAFRKGVYDYIKEDYDESSQQIIPRKYFSGGLDLTGQEFVQGQTQQRRKAGGLYNLETDLRFTSASGEGGAMGRWKYESTSFDPQTGQLTLHNAIRIPRGDGVVEEEFLIQGENKPRDIVLQTREFREEENRRLAETKMELGQRAVPFRIIVRDNSAINNRVYGFAAHGHGFLREDILTEGTKGQIKEALDHEARELSDALHVNIREEQFQGGLRELITILSTKDKEEGLSYFKKRSRVWSALDNETPVIEESSEYGARLYFLGHGLHMYISMSTGGHQSIYVSNMGKNHVIRGYTYEGENPGGEILIYEIDKELLRSKVRQLLSRLRSDRGIDELLRVVEKNEAETARMDALKAKYARDVVTDEEERAKILEELNPLLDIDLEELTSGQVDRIQQLVAALGNDPIYTAEKKHADDWPTNHGMDRSIYNIKQGDVLYIQYGVMSRDNEEEVFAEVEGQIQEVPRFGGKSVLTMADGTEINLNQVREIIVDNGRGGHYKVDKDAGGMDPYFFLMGGHLQREVIQGDLPDGVEVQQEGEYAYVQWPGVDKYLSVKFITAKKVTKEDAWSRMTGEKVTVLETPGTQNNGVFMYKRADGRFGDHDMVDINRIIHLGVDSEIAQLNSHQFKKGDRVVVRGEDKYFYGTVDDFYARAFIGRRMVVKLDNPPDPEKPFVHVKFLHQGEQMLVNAKNQFTKTQVPASFERLYETINTKFIITETRLLERRDPNGTMMNFWESFKTIYDILFGSEGMFEDDNFNVQALDEVFKSTIDMTLEEMVNGISGETQVEQNSPLALIGSLLDEDEKTDIARAYQEIRLGISLFAGQAATNTDTVPWVAKEQDLFRVTSGQTPMSDFTITALLRYFDNDIYPTFTDKVGLAHKVAGARERYVLQEELYRLYEAREKIEGLSPAAREMAAEEYIKKLTDPDDIGAMRMVLGLEPNNGSGRTMGRWSYSHTTLDESGRLTIHNATRIPNKDGVVEDEFLIDGINKPRNIVLQTRELSESETSKTEGIEQELGIQTSARIIVRDNSAIRHRIYGIAAQGMPFVREDIIEKGTRDQIKEAFDHEYRELTQAGHDEIRAEQYQGDLRSLIAKLSDEDKVGGIDMSSKWLDLKTDGKGEQIFFNMDPQQFNDFQIQGIAPFIINVTPLPTLNSLLSSANKSDDGRQQISFSP